MLAEWNRADVTFVYEGGGKGINPGLAMQFSDVTGSALFGEKKSGLEDFAATAN